MIDPVSLAFDIDGVIADTMTLFIDIARDEYHINGIKYEDITCYSLEECLDIDKSIIKEIIIKILDGSYSSGLKPIDGAPEILPRICKSSDPVLFVTARPYAGPICEWIQNVFSLGASAIEVITTGSFEGKADVLLERNMSYFVEDRLETCFSIQAAGITPVLFKQPWNREIHPFIEVGSWNELEALVESR